ncbi:predicted protein, partial [Arabidopsis lyrata subsp. lyrata]
MGSETHFNITNVNIGASPSAEEGGECQESNHLMTRKGSSLILINKYIKLLTPNLSEEDQAAFKKSI